MPPAELEAVLVSHPKVKEAGVVGMPMEDGGEAPKAFVVSDDGVDPDELMAYVAERVAPYKRIREVEFVDEIPKSASGRSCGASCGSAQPDPKITRSTLLDPTGVSKRPGDEAESEALPRRPYKIEA